MKRPCLTCRTPAQGSYCPTHAPRKQTTSASKRGLGWDHQKMAARVLAEEKVCWMDGLPGTVDDPLTADHIIPRSKGGTNARSNYRAAHASCNSRRGTRPAPSEAVAYRDGQSVEVRYAVLMWPATMVEGPRCRAWWQTGTAEPTCMMGYPDIDENWSFRREVGTRAYEQQDRFTLQQIGWTWTHG